MRFGWIRSALPAAMALTSLLWLGCGASNDKCVVQTYISPSTASADHTLAAPGNQAQFQAVRKASNNCVFPAVVSTPNWQTSDPANTSIDQQTGLATCLKATPTVASITYTDAPSTGSYTPAALTCK